MLRANRPLAEGETIVFDEEHHATLGPQGRERELEFSSPHGLAEWLESFGEMPIPPYLDRSAEAIDKERYQTIFARNPGAVAAPTAGLHLSARMLENISAAGARIARLTLHVGAGTFRPVQTENIEEHEMDAETYILPEDAVASLHDTKAGGGRILAVGTTVVRALESAYIEATARGPDATGGGVQHPPVHEAGFSISGGGHDADQLSPAAFDPAYARGGVRGQGENPERIHSGD